MTQVILTPVPKDELINEILEGIQEIIDNKSSKEDDEIINSKICRELLGGISAVTQWDYDKKGILKPYKVGSKKLYRKKEVLEALKMVEPKRLRYEK